MKTIKKLKGLLKAVVFAMLMVFVLHGCDDDMIEKKSEKKTNFIFKTLNNKDVSSNKKVTRTISFFKGLQSKSVYSSEFDFTIETDKVTYIEDIETGYHSYNFYIFRNNPQDDNVENLVISQNNSNGYDTYIIKYDFTIEDLNNNTKAIENANNTITKISFNVSSLPHQSRPNAIIILDGELYICDSDTYSANGYTYVEYYNCTPLNGGSSATGGDNNGGDNNGGDNNGGDNNGTNNNESSDTGYTNNNQNNNNNDDFDNYDNHGGNESLEEHQNSHSGTSSNNGSSSQNTQLVSVVNTPSYAQLIADCLNTPRTDNQQTTSNFDFNDWLDDAEIYEKKLINQFLEENDCSNEAQDFVEEAMEAMMDNNLTQEEKLVQIKSALENVYPLLPNNLTQNTYSTRVLQIANWIKTHGQIEIGLYIESLIPEFSNMTVGEVYDIYKLSRDIQINIQAQFFVAIVYTIAKTFQPFLEFAVIDATLGVAIPILAKIPLSFVTRGARLEAMVSEVGLMGIQGTSNSIRIVTTTSPLAKAEELFATLTKDATTTSTYSNGTKVAFFNNGNKIVFRTQSSSGFPATLELTFSEIWTQTRIVKFQ